MGIKDNLISWWKLDEASGNAIDAHGANDLTDTNTVGAAAGKVNGARDFESGSIEYFTIADNTDLSTGDIDFTICGWVNSESGGQQGVVGKWDPVGTNREYLFIHDTAPEKLEFWVSNNGTTVTTVEWSSSASLATWYFVVCWHDATSNTINIQVDNGTVVSQAHTTGVFNGTAPFRIGNISGVDLAFDGLIDEVGFWKRVLTAGERTTLYNAGAGVSYDDLAIQITTTSLPDGVLGSPYSETIATTGGGGSITFTIEAGSLPDGLTLNASTGEISGTPTGVGSTFTIRATDASLDFDEQDLEIAVPLIFDELDLTRMDIDTVAWTGSTLVASFGNGYGARAVVGDVSGLHQWVISSTVLADHANYNDDINGVPTFEYYWEFFKTHTTGTTDIFIIEFRGKQYHASFADPTMTAEMMTIDLFSVGNGLAITQRRVQGVIYNADGSIAEELFMLTDAGDALITEGGEAITVA